MIPKKSKRLRRLVRHLTLAFTHAILDLQALMLKKLVITSIWLAFTPALIILLSASLTIHNSKVKTLDTTQALKITEPATGNNIEGQVLGTKIEDPRPFIVARFLKGTPLEPYSDSIVKVSDEYGIDYRLIPAIAMKESGAGAAVDEASHNAWGFENGKTYFDSWEAAIPIVAKTLKTRYVDKGLISPEQIMPVYAPPALASGGGWAKDINFFFSQMETL